MTTPCPKGAKHYQGTRKWVFIVALASLLIGGCKSQQDKFLVRLDMSAERDAGRFLPDKGDRVSIAGNFNEWVRDSLTLVDRDGDWIYTLPLDVLLTTSDSLFAPGDTLLFKFIHSPGDEREIANEGWETIENRRMTLVRLKKKSPAFIFNEPFDLRHKARVHFAVGMRNQMTLGFFKPERGDRVVVTGDFLDWNEEGIPMADPGGDGAYMLSLPVRYAPGRRVAYKFRIISDRKDAALLNGGWEETPNRTLIIEGDEAKAPFATFGNIRRVLRFVIDANAWIESGMLRPRSGDIMQIKLYLDDQEQLSDALLSVGEGKFETALVIPLQVEDVWWQLVKNVGEETLTSPKEIEVDLGGRLVRFAATKQLVASQ